MPIDGCTSSFGDLATCILPRYMDAMRREMERAIPLRSLCQPREGARLRRERFGPSGSGCYVLLRDGKPFYVGISRRVRERLRQHVLGKNQDAIKALIDAQMGIPFTQPTTMRCNERKKHHD